MRITCLVDNTVQSGSPLWGEHGLSFLIETEHGGVLFDAGESGTVLVHNMEALHIDTRSLCGLAISHGHYDHTGGLPALLERTPPALSLYAHPEAFRARFSRRAHGLESIGSPVSREWLAERTTLRLSADPQQICPGVWTSGEIAPRAEPEGRGRNHVVPKGTGWAPDPYRDDISLVIKRKDNLILLCGCCHAGLLNTITCVERRFERPIVALIGGTHLTSVDQPHRMHIVHALQEKSTVRRVYLNHCSGTDAYFDLRLALGADIVHPYPAGTVLDLEAFS